MISCKNSYPSEEDIDKVRLAITKMIFDNGLEIVNVEICNKGTYKDVSIQFREKMCKDD